jgi:hypothetical protein
MASITDQCGQVNIVRTRGAAVRPVPGDQMIDIAINVIQRMKVPRFAKVVVI